MRRAIGLFLLMFLILPLHPASSAAESVIMNDNGYLYVDGAFPYALEGDKLGGVGFVSSTSPPISADLSLNEMTWSLSDLVIADQFEVGTKVYTNFSGGTIRIYLDPAMNADYGTNPTDPVTLISFEDGDLFLQGTITAAYMMYDTAYEFGNLVTLVNFTNGTGMVDLEEPNGNIVQYTFGPNDPNIPTGYVLQSVGTISVPALCTVKGNVSFVYDPDDCYKCDGITRLVLDYSGSGDLSTVSITGGVNFEVLGTQLIITPNDLEDKLPGNIKITVGTDEVDIHTSCSRPIEIGNVIDGFSVMDIEKIIIPCEEANCDGITKLVLQYNGVGDVTTVTVSEGAYATVDGDQITILPTGDELKGNTTVTIDGDEATIHTSCSQPLEIGFVFGEYEVIDVEKVFTGGGGSPTSGPVVGVTVDLVDGEGNSHTTLTDEDGNYIFYDVATEDISVSIIVPLGYEPITPTDVDIVCLPGDVAVVDFVLKRMATQDKPRSCGFWKHQVTSALKGKQKGVQVPASELLVLFEMIHSRFDQYFEIFIPVVTLEDFNSVFSLKSPTMYEKARRQFAGLLLNVVSNRLSTWQFASDDDATVSQAITYVSQLLIDGDDSNDELAKDIAEMINLETTVGAGVIPLDIGYIAYWKDGRIVPDMISNVGNYPNPFNPVTTITYELNSRMPVFLTIYNVRGQKVKELIRGEFQSGYNTVGWDGRNDLGRQVSAGVYYYSIKAGNQVVTRRMVMVR